MSRSADPPERTYFAAGVEKLRSALVTRGFVSESEAPAVSSAGIVAVGYFRKNDIEIGLIVRSESRLGCPNYTLGHGYAGHADLVWALGHAGQEQLVEGEWLAYVARSGGDPFGALRADLEHIVLPTLDRSEAEFRAAVAAAVQRAQSRLGA